MTGTAKMKSSRGSSKVILCREKMYIVKAFFDGTIYSVSEAGILGKRKSSNRKVIDSTPVRRALIFFFLVCLCH